MKQIKIAGIQFEILSQSEAQEHTKNCSHYWIKTTKEIVVNPAREFVKGYGSNFVSVVVADARICSKCGLMEIDSELEKAIRSGKLDSILKRPSRQQTICQLLRELHNELPKYRETIDTCLLIAKKMNDKLVEYSGTTHAKDWYDNEGNFIE